MGRDMITGTGKGPSGARPQIQIFMCGPMRINPQSPQSIVMISPRFSGLKPKLRRAWTNRNLTCEDEQRPAVDPNSRPSIKGDRRRKKYNT